MGQSFSSSHSPTTTSKSETSILDAEFPIQYKDYNEAGSPIDEKGNVFKPCCVCLETKKARDECMLLKGEEEQCQSFILRHQACLRSYGFQVPKTPVTSISPRQ